MAIGSSKLLCSQPADVSSEPMAGSAGKKPVGLFLMLEYRGTWGSHVAATPELPDPATHRWLEQQRQQLSALGDTAVKNLFIRRSDLADDGPLHLFLAQSSPGSTTLFRLQVDSYEQLHEIDLRAVLRGEVIGPCSQRLILVCTHQERDKCCAMGEAICRQLRARGESEVWGSSHLGGHRYAPTLLVLPEGSMYGRVGKQDAARLVAAWQRNELWLDRLRGRTWYGQAGQAADAYLRQHLDCSGADALVVLTEPAKVAAGERVEVLLQHQGSGDRYRVELAVEQGPEVLASCGPPARFMGRLDQRWTADSAAQLPTTRPLRFRSLAIERA